MVRLARESAATLAGGRLVCIDGPAGSGKTTLAGAVARAWGSTPEAAAGVRVVHLDDLYPGWEGLRAGVEQVAEHLVAPLAEGRPGGYRRYDWAAAAPAGWVRVPPTGLLVLEGCGAGAAAYDDAITVLVWVEADDATRLQRGLTRDGSHLRQQWEAWMAQERALFAAERTQERADLAVRT
ncbi:4-amino-4-deoxy-L-arabinose transferase [Nocardioides mesophilus]|uniref:4-amino-4-deoxy-L-arabinose transferase n=1 Tax=Nocardioides mesophilus TaxID=433659 RepID=A0A7G9RHU2_9ACTN|nr:4-amino-4-deoxy-L-arabinose transferase [Nocardioides mesophilus]